jgi:hypothetical protein
MSVLGLLLVVASLAEVKNFTNLALIPDTDDRILIAIVALEAYVFG